MTPTADWQELSLTVAANDVAHAEALLELAGAAAVSLADAGDEPVLEPPPGAAPLWPVVTMRALFPADADLAALGRSLAALAVDGDVAAAHVPVDSWRNARGPRAGRIGRRLWLGPADARCPDPKLVAVHLRMGLAFGTGEHPTTALCLEWLDSELAPGATVLDYGCGSGVLAIAALKLGASRAFAVDNDPQALTATRDNAALNGVEERVAIGASEALPTPAAEVLLANILADPLVTLAPRLAASVTPGGALVLSGILDAQREHVIAAYAPFCTPFDVAARDGWLRLAARRRPG